MKQLDEKLTPNIMSASGGGDSGIQLLLFPFHHIPIFGSHRNVFTTKQKKTIIDELIHRPKNRLSFIIYCFGKTRVQSIKHKIFGNLTKKRMSSWVKGAPSLLSMASYNKIEFTFKYFQYPSMFGYAQFFFSKYIHQFESAHCGKRKLNLWYFNKPLWRCSGTWQRNGIANTATHQ